MADSNPEDESWKTPEFREKITGRIEDEIRLFMVLGRQFSKTSTEMENHVFSKAKTKEEYLGFVAKLLLHIRERTQ